MSFPPPPSSVLVPSEPPLWAPLYGASIGAAFARFWKKYATFSGRASRSEFWWWQLIWMIITIVFEIILVSVAARATVSSNTGAAVPGPAYFAVAAVLWVISLGVLVPTLAVTWRRLHDTNRSGGNYFLGLIPLVGGIILLVFLAGSSNPAGARFDQPRP
jgi:uncharacterized membrane protein YhaH (DUF805 family)